MHQCSEDIYNGYQKILLDGGEKKKLIPSSIRSIQSTKSIKGFGLYIYNLGYWTLRKEHFND